MPPPDRLSFPTVSNLIRRGQTWCARLHIPEARWADVGRAMGAPSGLRREIVRTLGTKDYREAQRRRDPALAAIREEVDAALSRARLKPLSDWTADWQARALELRAVRRDHGDDVTSTFTDVDPRTGEDVEGAETVADLLPEIIEAEAEQVARRHGWAVAHRFRQTAIDPRLTIAEAMSLWLAEQAPRVRGGTAYGYTAALNKLGAYLTNHEGLAGLEGTALADVTRKMAGEFIATRAHQSAPATVQREFSAYNGLWRWAVRRGHIETNPWHDQSAGIKVAHRSSSRPKERAYTAAETVKLLRASKDDLAPANGGYAATFWDLLRLALLTGCRAEELLSLRRSDVIADGTAIVVAAGSKGGKTENAARVIPLHDFASAVLGARMASLPDSTADAPLWPEVPAQGVDGRRSKTIATRFVPIRRRILGDDDTTDFHSLRRTFLTAAETALNLGGRLNSGLVSLLAGQKRGTLALDLYSDWAKLGRPKMTGALADKLGTLRAAVDDIVALGFAPEVRQALAETAAQRPPVVRTAPAFSRLTPSPPPPAAPKRPRRAASGAPR